MQEDKDVLIYFMQNQGEDKPLRVGEVITVLAMVHGQKHVQVIAMWCNMRRHAVRKDMERKNGGCA